MPDPINAGDTAWVLVSAALDEQDIFNAVEFTRELFESLAENTAVEGIQRGKVCERCRCNKNYGTEQEVVSHHSTIHSEKGLHAAGSNEEYLLITVRLL